MPQIQNTSNVLSPIHEQFYFQYQQLFLKYFAQQGPHIVPTKNSIPQREIKITAAEIYLDLYDMLLQAASQPINISDPNQILGKKSEILYIGRVMIFFISDAKNICDPDYHISWNYSQNDLWCFFNDINFMYSYIFQLENDCNFLNCEETTYLLNILTVNNLRYSDYVALFNSLVIQTQAMMFSQQGVTFNAGFVPQSHEETVVLPPANQASQVDLQVVPAIAPQEGEWGSELAGDNFEQEQSQKQEFGDQRIDGTKAEEEDPSLKLNEVPKKELAVTVLEEEEEEPKPAMQQDPQSVKARSENHKRKKIPQEANIKLKGEEESPSSVTMLEEEEEPKSAMQQDPQQVKARSKRRNRKRRQEEASLKPKEEEEDRELIEESQELIEEDRFVHLSQEYENQKEELDPKADSLDLSTKEQAKTYTQKDIDLAFEKNDFELFNSCNSRNLNQAKIRKLKQTLAKDGDSLTNDFLNNISIEFGQYLDVIAAAKGEQRGLLIQKYFAMAQRLEKTDVFHNNWLKLQEICPRDTKEQYANWLQEIQNEQFSTLEKAQENSNFKESAYRYILQATNIKGQTVLMVAIRKKLDPGFIINLVAKLDPEMLNHRDEHGMHVLHYCVMFMSKQSSGLIQKILDRMKALQQNFFDIEDNNHIHFIVTLMRENQDLTLINRILQQLIKFNPQFERKIVDSINNNLETSFGRAVISEFDLVANANSKKIDTGRVIYSVLFPVNYKGENIVQTAIRTGCHAHSINALLTKSAKTFFQNNVSKELLIWYAKFVNDQNIEILRVILHNIDEFRDEATQYSNKDLCLYSDNGDNFFELLFDKEDIELVTRVFNILEEFDMYLLPLAVDTLQKGSNKGLKLYQRMERELEYFNALNNGAFLDVSLIPTLCTLPVKVHNDETVIFAAIRKQLVGLENLIPKIGAVIIFSFVTDNKTNILNYWAQYVCKTNLDVAHVLLDRYLQLYKSNKQRLLGYKKSFVFFDMNKDSLLHVLLQKEDPGLVYDGLKKLSSYPKCEEILIVGLVRNNVGHTIYTLLQEIAAPEGENVYDFWEKFIVSVVKILKYTNGTIPYELGDMRFYDSQQQSGADFLRETLQKGQVIPAVTFLQVRSYLHAYVQKFVHDGMPAKAKLLKYLQPDDLAMIPYYLFDQVAKERKSYPIIIVMSDMLLQFFYPGIENANLLDLHVVNQGEGGVDLDNVELRKEFEQSFISGEVFFEAYMNIGVVQTYVWKKVIFLIHQNRMQEITSGDILFLQNHSKRFPVKGMIRALDNSILNKNFAEVKVFVERIRLDIDPLTVSSALSSFEEDVKDEESRRILLYILEQYQNKKPTKEGVLTDIIYAIAFFGQKILPGLESNLFLFRKPEDNIILFDRLLKDPEIAKKLCSQKCSSDAFAIDTLISLCVAQRPESKRMSGSFNALQSQGYCIPKFSPEQRKKIFKMLLDGGTPVKQVGKPTYNILALILPILDPKLLEMSIEVIKQQEGLLEAMLTQDFEGKNLLGLVTNLRDATRKISKNKHKNEEDRVCQEMVCIFEREYDGIKRSDNKTLKMRN